MEATTTPVKVADLKVNDRIICPASGLIEQVTRVGKPVRGRIFVRTTRHDHNRPADSEVELVTNYHR